MLFPTAAGFLLHAVYLMLRVQGSNGSFPRPLSPQEEDDCLARLEQGDDSARETLIEHNLRLVAHIVKKYYAEPADQDDLISIGTIGLIKAVSTYRRDKQVRLATYAARCIENEILMYFRANRRSAGTVSLSESVNGEEDSNSLALMDMISIEDEGLNRVDLSDRYRHMFSAMNTCLEPREKQILIRRYGLDGKDPLTQREIAKANGISRSYVSRIEKKALEKLRAVLSDPDA